jgi:hypothetical protein
MSVSKQYLVRKDSLFVAWDGKTLTDRPSQAARFSKTICERKYPSYEMLSFPEAYDQWFSEKTSKEAAQ